MHHPGAYRRPPRAQSEMLRLWAAYGSVARLVNGLLLVALAAVAIGPAPAATVEHRLLVIGDSLVAGYRLAPEQAFPARLEAALKARGHRVTVQNGGISGDTSAGGRGRLEWALADRPTAAIVEFGANDGLRGIDPEVTYANLDAMLATLKRRGVRTLLAGMLAPPNMGPAYRKAFDAIFPRLAAKQGVPLYPFFLDGVLVDSALVQRDGVHPSAAGVEVIVKRILPHVEALLR
ncbi:MAG: arylesterase [Alphaproteobacteria bacterium]|nr:arylesterase [Alphaproteobacteria bacterium]